MAVISLWTAPQRVSAQILPDGQPVPEKPPADGRDPDADADTVAAPAGEKIAVDEEIPDERIRETLERLLPRYPGVVRVEVDVETGVVELEGHVRTEDVRGNVTQFVRRVEGVRLVLNRMQTDKQVLSASEYVRNTLADYWRTLERTWLLALLALVILFATGLLVRLLSRIWDSLLALFVEREMLRTVIASVLNMLIVVAGVMLALSTVGLTRAVLSVLGLAGIIGITLGFAFRDIGENFIASVLLGLRRPFKSGDLIQVAGHLGFVRAMNMRATILVTLEGNHVRIPNTIIFKEVLVNRSAAPQVRQDFEFMIPWSASIRTATQTIVDAMRGHPVVYANPAPQVYVERLETVGVVLKGYYWFDAAEVDPLKIRHDVLLRSRVALQQAGIGPPPPELFVRIPEPPRLQIERARDEDAERPPKPLETDGRAAAANLQRDVELAEEVAAPTAAPEKPEQTSEALRMPAGAVTDEGENLLDTGAR